MPDPSTSSGLRFAVRIRDAFRSTLIDGDVLEELAQHAESTYAEQRAEGVRRTGGPGIDRSVDRRLAQTDPVQVLREV